ncbi:MAG: hypothetical protein AAGI72_02950 [Pseudomonadota bacterium]
MSTQKFERLHSNLKVLFIAVILILGYTRTAMAQQSVFDGIDLTTAPIYLSSRFFAPGGTIASEDRLLAFRSTSTYRFEPDGSGSRNLFDNFAPRREAFSWSVVDEQASAVLLSFDDGVSGISSAVEFLPFFSANPFPGEREAFIKKWGQQVLDQLESVEFLFPALQIEVQRRIIDIRIVKQAKGIWTLTTTSIDTMLIPQEALNAISGGWQGDTSPTSSVIVDELDFDWERYDDTLFSGYIAQDFDGAWALPVYLDDPASAPLPTNRNIRFFEEKLEFDLNGFAVGSYSGKTYSWSLSGAELVLVNGTETFTYRLLDENLGIKLLSLVYTSDTNPVGLQLIGRGARFETSGQTFAQNPETQLPHYYQSVFGVTLTGSGEELACENVGGWFFGDDGTVRQVFCRGEAGEQSLLLQSPAIVERLAEQLTFRELRSSSERRRIWQILFPIGTEFVAVVERADSAFDFAGMGGPLAPEDFFELIAPRVAVFKILDLSLVGAPWDGADIDEDGLTNAEEDSAGTSYTLSDSDGDGLSDFEELELGSDPNGIDSDGDGLSDAEEVADGSDPTDASDPSSGLNLILIEAAKERGSSQ